MNGSNFCKVSKELLIEIISDLNKVRDIFLQCYLLLEISFFIFQCLLSHNKEKRKVENLLRIKKSQFSTFSNFVQNLSIRGRSSYLLNQSNER